MGKLTEKSDEVTGWSSEPNAACAEIIEMKEKWPAVPVEGEWIPAKTTVTECKVVGTSATLKMSAEATKTAEVRVTVGHKTLGWHEPMARIGAKYPTQTLLVQ